MIVYIPKNKNSANCLHVCFFYSNIGENTIPFSSKKTEIFLFL